jgi:dedicator of cytokinesis protein 3
MPLEDPLSLEVVSTLREWFTKWRQLYLNRDNEKFESIRIAMDELIEWRKQLISSATTSDMAKSLKAQIVAKIDWGNDLLGLDFVPRLNYELIDPESKSPLELLDIHLSQQINNTSNDNKLIVKSNDKSKKNHLMVNIRETSFLNIDDQIQIDFSLYDGSDYVTEKFIYKPNAKLNKVIFTDLSSKNVSTESLQLCVQVWRFGKINLIPVSDLIRDVDVSLKLYDGDLANNLEVLLRKQTNKLTHSQNTVLQITCKLLFDELPTNMLESPNTCIALTRGFGDIISAGHVRNDLYLSVETAEFEKGGNY